MKITYCIECAAPLTKISDTDYHCENGHFFYNNPHTACSVVFMDEKHQVLYAKRGHEPLKGYYDFPGGFLSYYEDGYRGAQREIFEETGVYIKPNDLQLIDTALHGFDENETVCDLVFLCRNWQGTFKASDDVETLEWKPLDFMLSKEFAWPYPYLYNKLQAIANHEISASH